MNNIFKIEMVNKDRLDIDIKGTPPELVDMIVQIMLQQPEVVEIILRAAEEFKVLRGKSSYLIKL